MIFDNTHFSEDLITTKIETGLHIILTTDEDDSRPVYISGKSRLRIVSF
jgi:hypothetical protein